jgi:hypothetical protein
MNRWIKLMIYYNFYICRLRLPKNIFHDFINHNEKYNEFNYFNFGSDRVKGRLSIAVTQIFMVITKARDYSTYNL